MNFLILIRPIRFEIRRQYTKCLSNNRHDVLSQSSLVSNLAVFEGRLPATVSKPVTLLDLVYLKITVLYTLIFFKYKVIKIVHIVPTHTVLSTNFFINLIRPITLKLDNNDIRNVYRHVQS